MPEIFRKYIAASRRGVPLLALLCAVSASNMAHAVVVRGTVTDPLGAVVVGARVQLIQGTTVVAFSRSQVDGSFEIRSTARGRFRLLTSAATFTPAVGEDFYGGVTDIVPQNVVLEISSVTESVTITATGIPTPIQQASAAVSLISQQDLATRLGISDELRQAPGIQVVQQGQTGGVTSLFVRGGNSTANKVLIDGIPAEDVGGTFDFGTVAQTAVASVETYRGPNSVLYGSDAGASVVSLSTPRGDAIRPTLVYTGDGGNFETYRNQAELSGAHQRLDYYTAFGLLYTANALPLDKYQAETSAANLGYAITPAVQARFTFRNAYSASGLPGAHDFFGISNNGHQYDQDTYSGLTLESRTNSDRWHNLVRYGIARKREQARQYAYEGTPVFFPGHDGYPGYTEYFGNVVTIRGANGYTATGQTDFFGATRTPIRTATSCTSSPTTRSAGGSPACLASAMRTNAEATSISILSLRRMSRSSAGTTSTRCSFRATSRTASSTRPAERSKRTTFTALRALRASGSPTFPCVSRTGDSAAPSCGPARRPACRSPRWRLSSPASTTRSLLTETPPIWRCTTCIRAEQSAPEVTMLASTRTSWANG